MDSNDDKSNMDDGDSNAAKRPMRRSPKTETSPAPSSSSSLSSAASIPSSSLKRTRTENRPSTSKEIQGQLESNAASSASETSSDDAELFAIVRSKRPFEKRNYRQRTDSAAMQTPSPEPLLLQHSPSALEPAPVNLENPVVCDNAANDNGSDEPAANHNRRSADHDGAYSDISEDNEDDNNNRGDHNRDNVEEVVDDDDSESIASSDSIDDISSTESSDLSIPEPPENEIRTNKILDLPRPKYDLNILQNIINRQYGIYQHEQRVTNWHGLTRSLQSSMYSMDRLHRFGLLDRHEGCVNCLNFNRTGSLLVTGSDDLNLIIWDWMRRRPVLVSSSGHKQNVFQAKFLDNNCTGSEAEFNLISSGRDGEVRYTRIRPTGEASHMMVYRHNGAVHKIATFDTSQNEIWSAGEDSCIIRSDIRDPVFAEVVVRLRHRGHPIVLYSIAAHPTEPQFCVAGRDKLVRIYDKRNTKDCARVFCPEAKPKGQGCFQTYSVTCAIYNNRGNEILASYGDGDIFLFDTTQTTAGTYAHRYRGHRNRRTIKGVNFFGPNSEYVMSGSDCGNIFIWHKETEAIVQWYKGDAQGVVNCLEGHPHYPIIATSGLDTSVKLWAPMNIARPPFRTDLSKCVNRNLHARPYSFVRSYMRNVVLNDDLESNEEQSNSESSDDYYFNRSYGDMSPPTDDDDGRRPYYNGPCEVQ